MGDNRYLGGVHKSTTVAYNLRLAAIQRHAAIEALKPVNHGWTMLPGFDDKGRIVYMQFGYQLRYVADKGQWGVNLPGSDEGELIPGTIAQVTEVVRQMARPAARVVARIEAGRFWAVQWSDGQVVYEDKVTV